MKNIKCALCILLIFILGAASGVLAMHCVYKRDVETFRQGDRKAREEILMNRLMHKLDLDDGQREQARAIVEKTHAEMDNIRTRYCPRMEALMEKSRAEMRQILRPDQKEKFEQFLARHKARHGENNLNP